MLIVAPLVLIGLVVAAFDWEKRYPWLLSATLGLPASAAIAGGGQAVPGFVVVSLVVVTVAVFSWLRNGVDPLAWPGATFLAVFVGWCLVVTLAGPTLFNGVSVLSAAGGIDQQVLAPSRLEYSASNYAQNLYLLVHALLICTIVRRRDLSPHLLAPGLAIVMFASNWKLAADKLGVPYPASQIDSGAFPYQNTTFGGGYRLRGVFPEPSGLGIASVVALTFVIVMVQNTSGWRRVGYLAVGASALLNLAYAHSGTGTIGATIMAALLLVSAGARAFHPRRSLLPFVAMSFVVLAVLLPVMGRVVGYVNGVITSKLDSSSYSARSGADSFSYDLGIQVFGVGVGLGSNRPSSLWPMLFSCTGVIGVVSFVGLLVVVILRASRVSAWDATRWALIAALVCKSFAGSTLADPVLMFTIALTAHAALRASSPPEADHDEDARTRARVATTRPPLRAASTASTGRRSTRPELGAVSRDRLRAQPE